jgi:ABC-type proline/glycine betaine transport system ATPase subunit
VLEAGRVSQAGTWAELAAAPATPFVHRAVAAAVERT